MKMLAALCAASMLTTAVHAQEIWQPFRFKEHVDPITDEVSWVVRAVSNGPSHTGVEIACTSTAPKFVSLAWMVFVDGTAREKGESTLKIRFDKDQHMEFSASISKAGALINLMNFDKSFARFIAGDPTYDLVAPEVSRDVLKIMDGLHTKTTMAFQIANGRPVFVPLTGSTAAMAKLDATCPMLAGSG